MHDEQIKVDKLQPQFAKESTSSPLLPYNQVVKSLKNSYWLVSNFGMENSLVVPTMQRA